MGQNAQFGAGIEISAKDNASPALGKANASLANLMGSFSRFSGVLGMISPQLGFAAGGVGQMGAGFEGALGGLGKFGAMLPIVGIAVGAAVLGFKALSDAAARAQEIIRSSIAGYAEDESALAHVAAVTNLTAAETQKFGKVVDDLMMTYGGNQQEKYNSLQLALTASMGDAADATMMLDTANKLAVVSGMGMVDATQLLTTTMASYGGTAADAGKIADKFFALMSAGGKISLPALSAALGTLAPTANALGIGLTETGAALATLTAAGLKTNTAVQQQDLLFRTLGGLTDKQREKWRGLGIDVSEAAIAQGGILPVMQALSKATGGDIQQLKELGITGKAQRAAIILSTTGLKGFEERIKAVNGAQGGLDEGMKKVGGTLLQQMERWKGFKDVMSDSLGEVFMPFIKILTTGLGKVIDYVKQMPEPLQKVIFGMAGLALALPVAGKGVLSLGWDALKAGLGISILAAIVMPLAPVIAALAVPTLAFGAAVGVLGYSIYKNVGAQESFASGMNKIRLALQAAYLFISEGKLSGAFAKEMSKTENAGALSLGIKLKAVWDGAAQVFRGFKEVVVAALDGMSGALGPSMGAIGEWMKSLLDGKTSAQDFAKGIPFAELREFGRNLGEIVGDIIVVGAFIVRVTDFFMRFGAAVWDVCGGVRALLDLVTAPAFGMFTPLINAAIGGMAGLPLGGGGGAAPPSISPGAASILPMGKPDIVAPPPIAPPAQQSAATAKGGAAGARAIQVQIVSKLKLDSRDLHVALAETLKEFQDEGLIGKIELNMATQ